MSISIYSINIIDNINSIYTINININSISVNSIFSNTSNSINRNNSNSDDSNSDISINSSSNNSVGKKTLRLHTRYKTDGNDNTGMNII